MKVKVVTDSGSGLSKQEAEEKGIGFLPLIITAGSKQFQDGVDLDASILEDLLETGVIPTTSQPLLADVEAFMEECKKEGVTDLIQVNLSSGLSSTMNSVQASARRNDIKVHTIEPWTTLYTQKYLTLAAQKLVEDGLSPEEIVAELQPVADKSNGYLIVEDLNHLAAGGRLTPAAAKLGSMLKIKPIMRVSKASGGKVDINEKVRTFSKSMKKVVDKVAEELEPDKPYIFYIGNGSPAKTAEMKKLIDERISNPVEIINDPIYPVIEVHTGLGGAGIQYIEKLDGVPIK